MEQEHRQEVITSLEDSTGELRSFLRCSCGVETDYVVHETAPDPQPRADAWVLETAIERGLLSEDDAVALQVEGAKVDYA